MSYLLIQILVCLLIAGLIGLVIGWLLRGGCSGVLSDNDTSWGAKLDESNATWEDKVSGLVKEKDDALFGLNQTLMGLKSSLSSTESKLESTKAQTAQLETDWATKLQKTIEEHTGIETNLSQELSTLKTKLTSSESKAKEIEMKLGESESGAKEIEAKLQSAEEKAKQIELELSAKLDDTNSSWESKVQGLMSESDSKASSLGSELLLIKSTLTSTEEKLKSAQSEVDSAKAEAQKLKDTKETKKNDEYKLLNSIYEWKAKYKEAQDKLTVLENAEAEAIMALKKAEEEAKAEAQKAEEAEKAFMLKAKPVLLTHARDGKKDNLTLIKGIGKVLEERLNNLGVYHFDQIALWSADQQSWMDKRMSFPGRVEREEWVKQAKELADGVETEFSRRVKDGAVPTSKKR
jgi:predicted flap endonuclease-1-like 5' DNA nuclease